MERLMLMASDYIAKGLRVVGGVVFATVIAETATIHFHRSQPRI
jgi:hypothetical protein